MNIRQFLPISLQNVKGKVFFSIIAQMAENLKRNQYNDTSVHRARISGFSGCFVA